MMIRNKFDFKWLSYFRCASADEEAFDLMRESGCLLVHLGIESGDQEMLRRMNKFAKVEKYADSIRKLKERDIITSATVIVGFPGETEASVQRTIEFLDAVQPALYRAEVYYHSPLTPIHEKAKEYGLKGAGYGWRHNTMDWRRATQLVEEMYATLHGPVIMPIYNFDFWSIPYLMGKGFALEQIIDFTKMANEVLIQGFHDPSPDTTEQEKRLVSLFEVSAA
jgi:p-methyltransferase